MYVTIKKFADLSGLSENSIYQRIHKGEWSQDNKVIARMGKRVMVSQEGYESWLEGQAQSAPQTNQLKSVSSLKASAAVKESRSPRPLLT